MPLQFGNTGNLQNAETFLQYNSVDEDFEPGGTPIEFAPETTVECEQSVQQSSSASQ